MRCQDCGAPQKPGAEDCPFCGYPVAFHASSAHQRIWLRWFLLAVRIALTVVIVATFLTGIVPICQRFLEGNPDHGLRARD